MEAAASASSGQKSIDRAAIRFIVLIGVVSLFGDMTYEGARSITGPYLATLGASATIVGVVAGFGELVGYAIRLLSGYIGDRTGRYWTVTIIGYILNLFAVPLLALAGSWEIAVVLIVAERMGRALRAPTRDAMLSHAATRTGAGWAFGLHEAMDTTGAIIGPLAVSAALYFGRGYTTSFAMLVVPAILSIFVLLVARSQFPAPRDLEIVEPIRQPSALPTKFWHVFGRRGIHRRRLRRFFIVGLSLRKSRYRRTALGPHSLCSCDGGCRGRRARARALVRSSWSPCVGPGDGHFRTVSAVGISRRSGAGDSRRHLLGDRNGRTGIGDARRHRLHGATGSSRHGLRSVPHDLRCRMVRRQHSSRDHL